MANKYKFTFATPPKSDNPWTSSQSLGAKIETMFTRFIQRVVTWGHEFFAELQVDIFDASMKILQPGMKRAMRPLMDELMKNAGIPDYVKESLKSIDLETGESGVILEFLVIYSTFLSTITGGLAPVRRIAELRADEAIRSFLPSINELAQLHRMGLVSDSAYKENAAKLGLADPLIPVYQEFNRNIPAMGELFNGFWRGKYSESEFRAVIKRMGYNDKDSDMYFELAHNLPPLQDFIRFQVRDAFDDAVANQYGYDEGSLDKVNEFTKKLGYDKDIAKLYWRSHWNLPSPTQGYDMLHRGIIDKAGLETLLRVSDYPKFWREKLMAMSFHPFTRVDIRRMYQAGVLNESEVFKAYKDIGYDDEKAQKLTDFTTQGASQKELDLTRSDILNMYEDNLLDRGAAEQALIKMGYDATEASQYMDMSDYEIAKATRIDDINYVREKYLAGQIDTNGVLGELNQLGLSSNQIERYNLQWSRSIETKTTFPSKADAVKFFQQGLIDVIKFRSMLTDLGYKTSDIDLYVLLSTPAEA